MDVFLATFVLFFLIVGMCLIIGAVRLGAWSKLANMRVRWHEEQVREESERGR